MALLLRLLVPAVLIGVIAWMALRLARASAPPSCRTCKHCRDLFPDGTICGFGQKEVFKNEVAVKNCIDYQRRRA